MLAELFTTGLVALSAVSLAYFLVVNTTYGGLSILAIGHLRRHRRMEAVSPIGADRSGEFLPEIAIIVPAYNESAVIVESVSALRSLEYPHTELVIVNDGSTDDTAERVIETFGLERIEAAFPIDLPCAPVEAIYRAPDAPVVLIDKENGGKADALNAGIHFTDASLFCSIDADSLIERGALAEIVEPFLTEPTRTVATGGTVRIANGVRFEKGRPVDVSLPRNRLVRFQIVEYLRAFFLGRTGLSRLGSLLIISGAFGLFRTDVVREIGGYEVDSITEDFELVVRLHRHLLDAGEDYAVTFVPHPIVWTEAPRTRAVLSRQRRRWFRGLLDTLWRHRGAIGRRRYGVIGLFALPFFLTIEGLGRLVEAAGYLLVPLLFVLDVLDWPFLLAFMLVAVGLGALMTALGVLGEALTYRRYDDPREILVMCAYAVAEAVTYRPYRAYFATRATVEYLLGDRSWGVMTRGGFGDEA